MKPLTPIKLDLLVPATREAGSPIACARIRSSVHNIDPTIEDDKGSHGAFVEYEVSSSDTPHAQSDVTFNKYGNVEFLSAIWVQGRKSEMQILPSKFEQNTAKAAAAEKHSLSAKSTEPDPPGRSQ